MTLTILASVSLLALVSSARPLPSPELDGDFWNGLQVTASGNDGNIQQVIQAVVKSHSGPPNELEEEDDVQIQLASSEELKAYIASTDNDIAVKALIPLGTQDELHSPDEKELYELLNRLEGERAGGSTSPVPDEALDSISLTSVRSSDLNSKVRVVELSPLGSSSTFNQWENESDANADGSVVKAIFISKPIIVMAVSCAIALLAVCCVAAALYIAETLRTSILRSTWDILPQLEKNFVTHGDRESHIDMKLRNNTIKYEVIEGRRDFISESSIGSEKMPGALPAVNIDSDLCAVHRPNLPRIYISAVEAVISENNLDESEESDIGDEQDMNEKFFDAEDISSVTNGGPLSDNSSDMEVVQLRPFGVGPFPHGLSALAAATATITAVAIAHTPEMDKVTEVETTPDLQTSPSMTSLSNLPDTRPSWSLRAQEAGALIHSCDEQEQRRRQGSDRGMFTAPQLDAALAMQLRPGLGIGADAAWLVRFVMALFGWCAVLMSGGRWGS